MSQTKTAEPSVPVALHNGNGKNGTVPPLAETHPWAQLIGSMKNDPTWDEYIAIMAENRRKDQEEFNARLDAEEALTNAALTDDAEKPV